MEHLSLYKELVASLEKLEAACTDHARGGPIPRIIATNIPAFRKVDFITEADVITKYCHALMQVLINGTADTETRLVLNDLLFDLVNYQADELKTPRYKAPETE